MDQTLAHRARVTIAAFTPNPAIAQAVSEAIGQQVRHEVSPLAQISADEMPPSLAVFDLHLGDAAEMKGLERILAAWEGRHGKNGVAILVTSPRPTIEGMRHLLRLGISDLLPQPLDPEDIRRAVESALARRKRPNSAADFDPASRGGVISLLKAGGGVGGTTLATLGLCALLSQRKERAESIALMDFDVQFGSAAFHLDLPQRASLVDLVATGGRLDGAMLRSAMTRHASGLYVLGAPHQIQPLDCVTPDSVLALLEVARREFACCLIELPLSWTAWTRDVAAHSDALLLVVQPEMSSLRHAKRQLEILRDEGLSQVPLQIVVNRFRKGLFETSNVSLSDIEKAINRPIDRVVPHHGDIAQAADAGKTLAEIGASRPAKRLASLFEHILAASLPHETLA